MALDQFRDGMPDKYRGLNSPAGTTGEQGLNIVPEELAGQKYTSVQFGAAGQQLLKGMRRAIRTVALTGNNVIVDDIILNDEFLIDYLEVLEGLAVYFVGVYCDAETLMAREALRPGRFPGTATGQIDTCHQHQKYDLIVDTSRQTPQACAQAVVNLLGTPPETSAFEALRSGRLCQ